MELIDCIGELVGEPSQTKTDSGHWPFAQMHRMGGEIVFNEKGEIEARRREMDVYALWDQEEQIKESPWSDWWKTRI